MTALTAPPINTLSLTQFREATRNYLDNEVEVEIVDVTTGVIRGGDGVFTVRVTNSTAERGVRLHDVTVHLELRAGGEIRLQPPTSPANLEARDGGSRSDRELSPNEQVNEMFVFFPQAPLSPQDDVLDPGESVDFEGRAATTPRLPAPRRSRRTCTPLSIPRIYSRAATATARGFR